MPRIQSILNLENDVLTIDDLPAENTRRWTASKKAIVARLYTNGIITFYDALQMYNLGIEEFQGWVHDLEVYGMQGLRVTYYQKRKVRKVDQN